MSDYLMFHSLCTVCVCLCGRVRVFVCVLFGIAFICFISHLYRSLSSQRTFAFLKVVYGCDVKLLITLISQFIFKSII